MVSPSLPRCPSPPPSLYHSHSPVHTPQSTFPPSRLFEPLRSNDINPHPSLPTAVSSYDTSKTTHTLNKFPPPRAPPSTMTTFLSHNQHTSSSVQSSPVPVTYPPLAASQTQSTVSPYYSVSSNQYTHYIV